MKHKASPGIKISPVIIFFNRISSRVTRATGSASAFFTAIGVIIVWVATGPIFDYSNTWQLVINTGTTIITFLMVFVIQQSQNKDIAAIHLKLNELIACNKQASNKLVDVEHMTDKELEILKKFYVHISKMSDHESELYTSHSLNEAQKNHATKIEFKNQKLKRAI